MDHRRTQKTFCRGPGGGGFGALTDNLEAPFHTAMAADVDEVHGKSGIRADQTAPLFGGVGILQTDFQMFFCHRISFFGHCALQRRPDIGRHPGRSQTDGVVHRLRDDFFGKHFYHSLKYQVFL